MERNAWLELATAAPRELGRDAAGRSCRRPHARGRCVGVVYCLSFPRRLPYPKLKSLSSQLLKEKDRIALCNTFIVCIVLWALLYTSHYHSLLSFRYSLPHFAPHTLFYPAVSKGTGFPPWLSPRGYTEGAVESIQAKTDNMVS